MKINPINVINLLLAAFSGLQIPESPVNQVEMPLAEKFENILYDSMNNFNAIDVLRYILIASIDYLRFFKTNSEI